LPVSQSLNIDALVDEQRFSRFNLNLLVWSFLAMLADGYDISALASAAPELARTCCSGRRCSAILAIALAEEARSFRDA
jgi:hypothetical protein